MALNPIYLDLGCWKFDQSPTLRSVYILLQCLFCWVGGSDIKEFMCKYTLLMYYEFLFITCVIMVSVLLPQMDAS